VRWEYGLNVATMNAPGRAPQLSATSRLNSQPVEPEPHFFWRCPQTPGSGATGAPDADQLAEGALDANLAGGAAARDDAMAEDTS
jgi:hypothetical protein